MLDERIYESYIGILKEEMVPAMGCTEPIALDVYKRQDVL